MGSTNHAYRDSGQDRPCLRRKWIGPATITEVIDRTGHAYREKGEDRPSYRKGGQHRYKYRDNGQGRVLLIVELISPQRRLENGARRHHQLCVHLPGGVLFSDVNRSNAASAGQVW